MVFPRSTGKKTDKTQKDGASPNMNDEDDSSPETDPEAEAEYEYACEHGICPPKATNSTADDKVEPEKEKSQHAVRANQMKGARKARSRGVSGSMSKKGKDLMDSVSEGDTDSEEETNGKPDDEEKVNGTDATMPTMDNVMTVRVTHNNRGSKNSKRGSKKDDGGTDGIEKKETNSVDDAGQKEDDGVGALPKESDGEKTSVKQSRAEDKGKEKEAAGHNGGSTA